MNLKQEEKLVTNTAITTTISNINNLSQIKTPKTSGVFSYKYIVMNDCEVENVNKLWKRLAESLTNTNSQHGFA